MVLLLGLAAIVLSRGPVSLAILTPYLTPILADPSAPLRVEFEDTILTWEGWERQLDVRIVGVKVLDQEGRVLANAPQMAVGFSAQGLLRGRIEPIVLELIAPEIRLVRGADGTIEFGVRNGQGGAASDNLVEVWREGDARGLVASLQRFSVIGADLSVEDRVSGAVWRMPQADLALTRRTDGIAVELATHISVGSREAFVGLGALYRGRELPLAINVNIADLEPAALARQFPVPEFEPLRALAMPLSGSMTVRLTAARSIEEIEFDLTGGGGALALPDLLPEPVSLTAVAANGRVSGANQTLVLDGFSFQAADGFEGEGSGTVARTAAGLAAQAQASLRNLRAERLGAYWPPQLAVPARDWIVKRAIAGRVTEAALTVDIKAGELEQPVPRGDIVRLSFNAEGASVRYWDPLPAITDATGHGVLTASEFHLTLREGRSGDVALTGGTLHIANIAAKGTERFVEIELLGNGNTSAAFSILDSPPLGLVSKLGMTAADAGGMTSVHARFSVPLKRKFDLASVGYSASARLTGFSLPRIFGRYPLSDGDITLVVSRPGLDASGTVALNGVPFSIAWRREFKAAANEFPDRYSLAARLDGPAREALGVRVSPYIDGETLTELSFGIDHDRRAVGQGRADLSMATLAIPQLRWRRAAARPSELRFSFTAGGGAPFQLTAFQLDDAEAQIEGSASFDDALALRRFQLQSLRLGENDFAATVGYASNGAIRAKIDGRSLDLRAHLTALDDVTAAPDTAPSLDLGVAVGRLLLRDDIDLTGARAVARQTDGLWRSFAAGGSLKGGPPVRLQLGVGEKFHDFIMRADDAGAVARALGWTNGASGGKLLLTARIPAHANGGAVTSGRVQADEFRVANAPALAQILSLGSLTGIRDVMAGDGVLFSRLDVPFTVDTATITLNDGRAVGPAIGITFDGTIDKVRDQINIEGVVVPSYSINSVLGEIPLLGTILVGRRGEGLFAVTYKINGPVEQPQVTVNPLSVLAPGFLRRIVEVLEKPAAADAEASQWEEELTNAGP